MEHPRVLEAAAIPVRSDLGEDEVMICVVRRPKGDVTAEELIEFCAKVMARFMVPRYVRFVPVLPKTPTEKIQKFLLREAGVTADTWDAEARRSAASGESR